MRDNKIISEGVAAEIDRLLAAGSGDGREAPAEEQ